MRERRGVLRVGTGMASGFGLALVDPHTHKTCDAQASSVHGLPGTSDRRSKG